MERILKKEIVYKGDPLSIEALDIDFGNGKKGRFHRGVFPDPTGIMAIPFDGENYLLIEQYQVGSEERMIVLPKGAVPMGIQPEDQLQEELAEEIGFRAKTVKQLSNKPFEIFPGYIVANFYVYLVTDLYESKSEGDEFESIKLVKISRKEIYVAIEQGRITDTRTVMGLLLADKYLNDLEKK
jgi:8-oxo-dGTP pyrophosphatase MutT (NUDIX family)